MRLTRTSPQPALPDEVEPGDWGSSYNGHGDPDGDGAGAGSRSGGRHSHRARRQRDDDDDEEYPQHHDGRRRWPIVTTLLVLLVLLIGGGLYGGWQYVQGQYYIGVQNGNVAIFRGVNQNLAGISLSSLIQRTTLPITQVVASNQGMIRQTIPANSLGDAQNLVRQIQSGVSECHQKWQALENWNTAEVRYLAAVTAFQQKKTKIRPTGNPGTAPPTPDAADCAPASAFAIPATALPGGQPTATPTTTPSTRPTTRPTTRPSTRTSAKASPSSTRAAA
jgi:protein phosphatase